MDKKDKRDFTWYIKWISSAFILFAVAARISPTNLKIFDLIFSLLGQIGWLYVAIRWQDRALILLNGVLTVMLISGLIPLISSLIILFMMK